jgi:hypothetical protein
MAQVNTIELDSRRSFLTKTAALAAAGTALAFAGGPATADPAFALIETKRAADVAHGEACHAFSEAEDRYGVGSEGAAPSDGRAELACHAAFDAGWALATTPPTTLAGIAAVLRFANEVEDAGLEWPNLDTIGPDSWHYQLRATMAAAVEALIKTGTMS